MVKGKRTGKLEVTSKPKVKKLSKGPLSKYSEEAQKEYKEIAKKAKKASIEYKAELVYEKKKSNFPNVKVGLEEIKDDMLKMMDKIDRLEDAFKYIKQRVARLDGRG